MHQRRRAAREQRCCRARRIGSRGGCDAGVPGAAGGSAPHSPEPPLLYEAGGRSPHNASASRSGLEVCPGHAAKAAKAVISAVTGAAYPEGERGGHRRTQPPLARWRAGDRRRGWARWFAAAPVSTPRFARVSLMGNSSTRHVTARRRYDVAVRPGMAERASQPGPFPCGYQGAVRWSCSKCR